MKTGLSCRAGVLLALRWFRRRRLSGIVLRLKFVDYSEGTPVLCCGATCEATVGDAMVERDFTAWVLGQGVGLTVRVGDDEPSAQGQLHEIAALRQL